MKKTVIILIILTLFFSGLLNLNNYRLSCSAENINKTMFEEDPYSTTGPEPSDFIVLESKNNPYAEQTIIDGVPSYNWYRGCGPTAVGMVIGYWDGHGYDNLVDGDASTRTTGVKNMISTQENWDDYCLPLDSSGPILDDKSELPHGDEHDDNCVADFMHTSQSFNNLRYGWSFYSKVDDSFSGYLDWKTPEYNYIVVNRVWGSLTWDNYCSEIDANHPVVLLVDTNGDGSTDHFITAIGYDDEHNYACYNTWDHNIHWYDFSQKSNGNPWGIYGATFFSITFNENNPPNKPSNPIPVNGAIDQSVNVNLEWLGGDPDPQDTVTYDIYFGITDSPPLVKSDHSSTYYYPSNLEFDTTYYWRIIPKDNHGDTNPGEIWSFKTEETISYYSLSISTSGNGMINLNPLGGNYREGTIVTVTASASKGWIFDHWQGDINDNLNPNKIKMDNDKSIKAFFIKVQDNISILYKQINWKQLEVDIKNDGDSTLSNLDWNIKMEGGLLGMFNHSYNGLIDSLEPDCNKSIHSNEFNFGLGLIDIKTEVIVSGKTYLKEDRAIIIGYIVIII